MAAYKIIDGRKEYAQLYLRAMDVYDMRTLIIEQDKTKKFQSRLEKLKMTNVRQNRSNDSWIQANFPELFR